ncbi:TPA: hypothetical protein G7139_004481 [Salmonella enterica subsp. enterica serovar Typhi]|uniref:Uncharacterized protein n=1 Tax=Salmonella paratyphi A TaxID=54388 RepID=A0A741P9K9_SALPT|nr:hypothetical protein [Salmonella enterica]EDV2248343.1 hypothetical protein [Salmonella enterica subsp. enterica serovar Paratyphi A]HAF3752330.1 hypothetical protein [Salmonella enterica subsp. enterica serovar Typhi]EBO6350022.1 hypothetical protein [Salmonella enterica]HAF0901759.1 hypothetical protein [Salmonella enterica subsp. enterica serovar Paratyphi A]
MFCVHRQFVSATKQRDKMCFWSTAHTPKRYDHALPDTLSNQCLQSVPNLFRKCLQSVPNLFRKCLQPVPNLFRKCLQPVPNLFAQCL